MQTNRPLRGGRGVAAPDRKNRTSVVTALAQAPVSEFMVFVLAFVLSVQIWAAPGIVLQVGAWAILAAYLALFEPQSFVRILKWWPLLLLPLYATASAIWSVAPGVSARYGIQLVVTALIAITMACAVTPRKFVALVYGGVSLMMVLSFTVYGTHYGPSTEGYVLIGATGSKNEMGYSAELLWTLCLAIIIDRGQPAALRASTLLMMVVSLYLLTFGHASGAVLMAALTTIVVIGAAFLHLFKIGGRIVLLIAMAIIIVPAVVERDVIQREVAVFMQEKLGKDTTLTGRTYLWARADELIRERPWLGRGYRAVMVGDTVEGRGILNWAGQTDGRAFHFHNTYRDVAVDLGYPGAIAFGVILIAGLLTLIRTVIAHPTPAYSFFLASYVVLVAKSPGELIIGQFNLTAALLFGLQVWAFAKAHPDEQWLSRNSAGGPEPRVRDRRRPVSMDPVRLARPARR